MPGAGSRLASVDWARRFALVLVLIAAAALVLRVAAVLVVEDRHFYGYDALWYSGVANELADGNGFVIGGSASVGGFPLTPWLEARPTAFFPPAYPMALSGGSLLGLDTLVGHQLLSSLFGAVTVVLIGVLGRSLAGPRVGLVAAALAAVHPLLIGADVALMSESLYGVVVTGLLVLAYRVIDRPDRRRWVALGLLGGAVALTRNEGVVLAVLVIIATAAAVSTARCPRRLRFAAVALGVTILVALPWVVRNAIRVEGVRGVAANPGATIAGANCEETYYGDRIGGWHFFCLEIDRWHTSSASEADFYGDLASEGIEYATGHIERWPVVVTARLGRVFSLYEPVEEVLLASNEGRHQRFELVGVGLYYVTVAGGTAGLMLLRRRRVAIGPLLAPVAVAALAALLHGNPRIRFAAEPTLLVATSVTLMAPCSRPRPGPQASDRPGRDRLPLVPSKP